MKGLLRRLVTESRRLLDTIEKRLDESQPGDESYPERERPPQLPPLEPVELAAQHPLGRGVSPLLFRENRKAIESVFARRGWREGDTIEKVLEEAKEQK